MTTQVKNMELYASENNFNIFYEKKRRELKNLQQLNEFVKPAPYFVYFMFKDTIHVDDYGSIKETLFKFPSMTRVSSKTQLSFTRPNCASTDQFHYSRSNVSHKIFFFLLFARGLKTKHLGFTCLETM